MVRIRMSRIGRKNTPFYRIGAYDSHSARNSTCLERLGWYNPKAAKPEQQLQMNLARVEYWLSVGAQPTPKMVSVLKHAGVKKPAAKLNAPKAAPKAATTTAPVNTKPADKKASKPAKK